MFIVGVIPPIIFFVAFVQLLYYWGLLQWFIRKFATVFFYTMGVSGAEAVVAAASPFVGQGESAMLIKPFIPHLTDAELHQVMTSGFATIAGSVLAAYIGMGISPLALVSSCVMSIPASLAISKLRWPETEESLTAGHITIPKDEDERASNSLHAFANGSWLGIKIAGMIIAGLLCILALLGLVDGLLGWIGRYLTIHHLSIQLILGYVFYPIAFLLGVDRNGNDLLKVAQLIGIKVVANEFVAVSIILTQLPSHANIRTVQLSRNRSKLSRTHRSIPSHCNLRCVRFRKNLLSWYPNRCPLSARPRSLRPRRKGRFVCSDLWRYFYFDLCQYRWYVDSRYG
jgi:CNT family concentrative nucleoside transporter